MRTVSSVVFALAVAGCVGIRVNSPAGHGPGAAGMPSPQRGASTATVKRGGPNALHTARYCRSAIPAGWIAIDYVADSGCTASKQDMDAHPVAIAVQYGSLQTGTDLEVCALERTPADWYETGRLDYDGRCPEDGAGGDATRSTVKLIRKR